MKNVKYIIILTLVIIVLLLINNKTKKQEIKEIKPKQSELSQYVENENESIIVIMNKRNESNDNCIDINIQSDTSNNEKAVYYIKVNTLANCVTVYTKDNYGNYNVPIKSMICSTRIYTPPCSKYPKSIYVISGTKWEWTYLQGNVWGHYVTKIDGNILFHSIPYTSKNERSLEYWEYDKLGSSASLGCVRLQIKDCKWIYDNVLAGTTVEFYKDENPGPFGKPEIDKIGDNLECRNWDPTDLCENNPWNT